MLRRLIIPFVAAGVLVFSLAGCTGGTDNNATAPAPAPTTDAASPTTDYSYLSHDPNPNITATDPTTDEATPTTEDPAPDTGLTGNDVPSSVADAAYVATVQGHSAMLSEVTPSLLINDGHLVCGALDNGASLAQVFMAAEGTGVSMSDAAFMDGAAIVAYCPQYKYLIPGQ